MLLKRHSHSFKNSPKLAFGTPLKVKRRSLPVHATQTGRRPRRRAGNKMLDQTTLLVPAQPALAHAAHDRLQTRLSGTAP